MRWKRRSDDLEQHASAKISTSCAPSSAIAFKRSVRRVTNYVDAHPLASVGIAFGVGYLLSGALFSRTTLQAATLGGRFALGGFLKQLVAGIGPGPDRGGARRQQQQHDAGSEPASTRRGQG